jgi:cytochrome c-type biogenesis protein CcmH
MTLSRLGFTGFIGPILASIIAFGLSAPVAAIGPDELLDDPLLETRARSISKQLRCVVCQNQSIDDSDAAIARDMRIAVRERLVAGDSDTDAIAFIVSRYGDFVLLAPPFKAITLPLWLGPPFLVLLVVALVTLQISRNRVSARGSGNKDPQLSEEDRKRLKSMLDGEDHGEDQGRDA